MGKVSAQVTESARSLEPILGLNEDTIEVAALKEKRVPPNVFLGQKTKRKVLRHDLATTRIYEQFYLIPLKEAQNSAIPDYVPYVYVFNSTEKKIVRIRREHAHTSKLLHGKYVRKWRKIVLDERCFYYGTPHGRWTHRDEKNTLIDKRNYHKGWSKDAEKSYYDIGKQQLKAVIPKQYQKTEGEYYAFHRNGKIAVIGNYKWGRKVGTWTSFYENGQKRKVLQYSANPLLSRSAITLKEWNKQGTLVYRKSN